MNIFSRNRISKLVSLVCPLLLLTACCEWGVHYDEHDVLSDETSIYDGDVASYIMSQQNLTDMADIYTKAGVLQSIASSPEVALIVTADDVAKNETFYAAEYPDYTIADANIQTYMLKDGYGIQTRSGKSIWVTSDGDDVYFNGYKVTKVVRANNGYIYYIDGVLKIQQSLYEYFSALPEDAANPAQSYAKFKSMVSQYYEEAFDKELSRRIGINEQGQPIYDSVFVKKNALLDRYDAEGIKVWDMFDEQYNSTMFIPSDAQIDAAIEEACANVELWLHHKPTESDMNKFNKWIVEACFINKHLTDVDVAENNDTIIAGVGNYIRVEDKVNDYVSYKEETPAYWNPSVNKLDVANKQELSNGVAYYTKNLHIPNHVVIYRIKSRLYELWSAMSETEQGLPIDQSDTSEELGEGVHFKWLNWQNPGIVSDAQGAFDLGSNDWPTIFYHVLTAEPTIDARDNAKVCSVMYDGTTIDQDETGSNVINEVYLPAGEYYLRMGFKHSLTYSVSIFFRTKGFKPGTEDHYPWIQLKRDMVLYAQGSNFHFDRGAASEVPHYGEAAGIAYPEGFDVDYWQKFNEKAIAYDTDGYTVGVVNIEKPGNFEIMITSADNAKLYTQDIPQVTRSKNNVQQLMMYHWCLRPTKNNY